MRKLLLAALIALMPVAALADTQVKVRTGGSDVSATNPFPVQSYEVSVAPTSVTSATTIFTQAMTGLGGITVQVTSPGTSSTVVYESSLDQSTWYQTVCVLAAQGQANSSGIAVTSTTTAQMLTCPRYGNYFRARVSVYGSGTVTAQATAFSAMPLLNEQTVSVIPRSAGGGTVSRVKSAASTNSTNVKSSGGNVYHVWVYNNTGSAKFLKLYNKASAPTVGTDTPVVTIPIPANGAASVSTADLGANFGTGIGYGITGAIGDSDTTNTAVDDVNGWIIYN